MKNFVIAVLIAILITYTCGHIFDEWFDISIRMDDELLSPFAAMAGMTLAGVILVVVGFVIAFSVFGVLLFVAMAVFVGLLIAGLSVFWPMIVLLLLVAWLVKDKKPAHYG